MMRTLVFATAVLAFAAERPALSKPLASKADPKTVIVTAIEADRGARSLGPAIERMILSELEKRPELKTMRASTIGDDFSARLRKCREKNDAACVEDITEDLDFDFILSGSVGTLSDRVGDSQGGETAYFLQMSVMLRKEAEVIERAAETAYGKKAVLSTVPEVVGQALRYREKPEVPVDVSGKSDVSISVFSVSVSNLRETAAEDQKLGVSLVQQLSTELSDRLSEARIVNPKDVENILKVEGCRRDLGGKRGAVCAKRIAGAYNVDYLLVGQVGLTQSNYVLSLQLMDAREAEVIARRTISFRGADDELYRAIRTVGRDILGIRSKTPGLLSVNGAVSEAKVSVNDELMGPLPLPPTPSPNGRVKIRLIADGYKNWESDVFIQPAEHTDVFARMEKLPEAWYEKWWVWTIVGAAAAAGGSVAVYYLTRPPETGGGAATVP